MSITIEDSDAVQESLDDSFVVRELALESPESLQSAALQHGGLDNSEGYYEPRRVSVVGVVYGDTPQEFQTKITSLSSFLRRPNLKLYPEYPFDRFLKLKRLAGSSQRFASGLDWRVAQVTFEFVCEDPFWHDLDTEINTFTNTASGTYVSFSNPGSIESFPVVTLVGLSQTDLFALKNVSDNDSQFVYADLALTSGTTLTVDAVEGTVSRDNVNTLRFLTGSFPRVKSGANTFYYAGNTIDIHFAYVPRYL